MKLLTCLLFVFATAMAKPKDIIEFFEGKSPSNLKWAHAVNTKDLLDKALKDTSINMIEADVRMGKLKTETAYAVDDIPIMSHDTAESDLSLEEFLIQVKGQTAERKVGIKLDFKDLLAYNQLDTEKFQTDINALNVPVLLNADVVKGPGKTPKAGVSIKLIEKLEGVLYSLGWTTGDFIEEEKEEAKPEKKDGEEAQKEKDNEYTETHVKAMEIYVKTNFVESKITFPVRAMFLSRNVKVFTEYLKDEKYTMTVWSAEDDDKHIKIPELSNFLLDNSKKVFVDIPKTVQDSIDKHRKNGGTSAMPMAATILAFIALALNYFN
ncbi:PREDICTED: protein FAM151B [Nicrophorus vespilloides]|uniref:Protein FAM151B n=1 Tax=Nicrophorus vespilloides TaxID=110193 RepID=A0ABM1MP52_NICVS|nr:PREDICTED: protein FAM151B [Nicrophorus vespilloides]